MSRLTLACVGVAALLLLTGCGESLEERISNRDACEAAGGKYVELMNINYQYADWACRLSTEEE